MKLVQIILMVLLAISVLADCSYCKRVVLQPTKSAMIASPSNAGDVRNLLYFQLPNELSSPRVCIDFALLACGARVSGAAMAQLDVFPLTTAWNNAAQPSWDGPWKQPGGDYSTEVLQGLYSLKSETGTKEIAVDVTKIVTSWLKGQLDNNGIIIMLSQDDVANFRAVRASFDARGAQLTIFYSLTD